MRGRRPSSVDTTNEASIGVDEAVAKKSRIDDALSSPAGPAFAVNIGGGGSGGSGGGGDKGGEEEANEEEDDGEDDGEDDDGEDDDDEDDEEDDDEDDEEDDEEDDDGGVHSEVDAAAAAAAAAKGSNVPPLLLCFFPCWRSSTAFTYFNTRFFFVEDVPASPCPLPSPVLPPSVSAGGGAFLLAAGRGFTGPRAALPRR